MENVAVSKSGEKDRTEDVVLTEHCNFDSFFLNEPVLQGLNEAGFHIPSPIQAKAIPLGKCGIDLIVQAKSGTGKTAVFTIVSLEMVDTKRKELQVVVVAPTREIAFQIKEVMTTIGKYIKDLKVACFIGGLPLEEDIKNAKGCHIAVGAPGRLTHLIKKGHLTVTSTKLMVLDEGDKLMETSFFDDINYICNALPSHKQMIAVSATFSEELKNFLKIYMHRSTFITPKVEIPILLGLRQFVSEINSTQNVLFKMKAKVQEVDRLFNKISFTQCMVFCNYGSQIDTIKVFFKEFGWDVASISSSESQSYRLKTIGKLKKFKCRILISTDLMARGIDATNVDLVINLDVPIDADTYLHRMGRAGRYGCKGLCITITTNEDEMQTLQRILGAIGGSQMSIAKLPVEDELLQDLFKCELNKLPRFHGITLNKEQSRCVSHNITKSILEAKWFHKKKLCENDTIPHDFERMCVEAIDENDQEVNKTLKSNLAGPLLDDKGLAAVSLPKLIEDEINSVRTADNLSQLALLDQWTLVKETNIEDTEYEVHNFLTPEDEENKTLLNNDPLIAYKNVTMFLLSEVLSNETQDLDDITNAITEYLNMLDIKRKDNFKEMSNLFSKANCQDILQNLAEKAEEWKCHQDQKQPKEKQSKVKVKREKNLLFTFGYNDMCKDDVNWIDGLGDKYMPIEEVEEESEDNEIILECFEEMPPESYEETNEFNVEEGENTNKDFSKKKVKKQRTKRRASEYNSNAYSDQSGNFYPESENYLDNYKHYQQYYNYPIKRFLKSFSKPVDPQQSEDSFKLWMEGMSEVTKYLHRGIYWDLMYHNNQH